MLHLWIFVDMRHDHFRYRKQQAKTSGSDHSFYTIFYLQTTYCDAVECKYRFRATQELHKLWQFQQEQGQ